MFRYILTEFSGYIGFRAKYCAFLFTKSLRKLKQMFSRQPLSSLDFYLKDEGNWNLLRKPYDFGEICAGRNIYQEEPYEVH